MWSSRWGESLSFPDANSFKAPVDKVNCTVHFASIAHVWLKCNLLRDALPLMQGSHFWHLGVLQPSQVLHGRLTMILICKWGNREIVRMPIEFNTCHWTGHHRSICVGIIVKKSIPSNLWITISSQSLIFQFSMYMFGNLHLHITMTNSFVLSILNTMLFVCTELMNILCSQKAIQIVMFVWKVKLDDPALSKTKSL